MDEKVQPPALAGNEPAPPLPPQPLPPWPAPPPPPQMVAEFTSAVAWYTVPVKTCCGVMRGEICDCAAVYRAFAAPLLAVRSGQ